MPCGMDWIPSLLKGAVNALLFVGRHGTAHGLNASPSVDCPPECTGILRKTTACHIGPH